MKNTTTKNPVIKNPMLKEIMKGYKGEIKSNIENNKVNFKKDFKIICTDEPLNERKLAIFIANAGYNFKDYFIQVFALCNNDNYEGCAFNEDGEVITSRDYRYKDFKPLNCFYRKSDFLSEIKKPQNKAVLIQKRNDLKSEKNYYQKYDYKITRFIKNDKYGFSINGDKNKRVYFNYDTIEKSGYYLAQFKNDLNNRLQCFKEQKRLKEYQELKNKNHLNKTKETLKKLLLNALDNFILKIKNATLKNTNYYKNNNCLVWAFKELNTLDNLRSVKDLTSQIKRILSTVKEYE